MAPIVKSSVFGDSGGSGGIVVLDSDLEAIANLTTTGAIERTGTGTASTFTVTTAAKTVLDDATTADMLTTLGGQPLDSDLTAIAGLATTGAIERTGSGAVSTFPVTAAGKELLNDTDAATMLATLGAQPLDSDLTAIAALTTTAYGRGFLTLADSSGITLQSGTWTPAYLLTVSGSVATSAANGIWYKIGKLVYAVCVLSSSSISSPNGSVLVSLPFSASTSAFYAATVFAADWAGSLTNNFSGVIPTTFPSHLRLYKGTPSSATTALVNAVDLNTASNTNIIRFSVVYEVP